MLKFYNTYIICVYVQPRKAKNINRATVQFYVNSLAIFQKTDITSFPSAILLFYSNCTSICCTWLSAEHFIIGNKVLWLSVISSRIAFFVAISMNGVTRCLHFSLMWYVVIFTTLSTSYEISSSGCTNKRLLLMTLGVSQTSCNSLLLKQVFHPFIQQYEPATTYQQSGRDYCQEDIMQLQTLKYKLHNHMPLHTNKLKIYATKRCEWDLMNRWEDNAVKLLI